MVIKKICKKLYHFKDNVRMVSVSFAIYSLKNMTNGKLFHWNQITHFIPTRLDQIKSERNRLKSI